MAPSTISFIEDHADPRIAPYREARDRQVRRNGLFLAEGRLVVRRLLQTARFTVRSVLATRAALDDLGEALLARPSVQCYEAPSETLRAVVGFKFHRGCLALAEDGPAIPVDALVAPAGPRLLLGLENVADPDNVGALFRHAAAFGVSAVLLSPGCADPLYRKAIRVSMGACFTMPFARADWGDGLARLRAAGYTRVALTPHPDAQLLEAAVLSEGPRRLALLVSAEDRGLRAASIRAADVRVRIAMAPGVDSLNVATAAAIALHRLADVARAADPRSIMGGDPP